MHASFLFMHIKENILEIIYGSPVSGWLFETGFKSIPNLTFDKTIIEVDTCLFLRNPATGGLSFDTKIEDYFPIPACVIGIEIGSVVEE